MLSTREPSPDGSLHTERKRVEFFKNNTQPFFSPEMNKEQRMKIRNEYLFKGILPGETEERIISILDKADKWNSLSQSARNDSWRMNGQEIRKRARKLDRLANEIVQDLIEWKLELALPENLEEVKQLSKHVQKDYY